MNLSSKTKFTMNSETPFAAFLPISKRRGSRRTINPFCWKRLSRAYCSPSRIYALPFTVYITPMAAEKWSRNFSGASADFLSQRLLERARIWRPNNGCGHVNQDLKQAFIGNAAKLQVVWQLRVRKPINKISVGITISTEKNQHHAMLPNLVRVWAVLMPVIRQAELAELFPQ